MRGMSSEQQKGMPVPSRNPRKDPDEGVKGPSISEKKGPQPHHAPTISLGRPQENAALYDGL